MVSTFEPVFRTGKCLGFVSCTHLELDTNGTPSAGGRCLAPVSELQVVAEAMKHTAMEELWLQGNEIGAEGAEAPLRRKSPGDAGRDGMNFPPKPWEVPWSSVPKRRILKNLKVQDSDGMYSINKITQYLSCSNLFSL